MVSNEAENWSTESLPRPRQFPGFQEVLDRTHFHWDLRGAAGEGYEARVLRRPYEDFVFTHVMADPVQGHRNADAIRKEQDGYFCLLYLQEGETLLEQGRNQSCLVSGSLSLWDSTRPAYFHAKRTQHQYSLLIPRQTALATLPSIEDLCGLRVPGDQGVGAILLSHLRQLHNTIEEIDPRDRSAILRATVELAAAAFRPELERLEGSAFRTALLRQVQEYIDTQLSSPDLGPQTVAAAFRFSPRYLHRLFEGSGHTVSEWIRERRLQHCRRDLENRNCDRLSLTQIALRHGFSDPSQFSRAFRQAYGEAPRALRQRLQGERQ